MKTLYISDLDGTLLHSERRVTARTADTLNRLIDKGLVFSVATARSLLGARLLNLEDIHFPVPLVLMNGVLLYDYNTRRVLQSCDMNARTAARVLAACVSHGKTPFLYQVNGHEVAVTYIAPTSKGERVFLEERGSRFPEAFRQVADYDVSGGAVYFSMQDTFETLEELRVQLSRLPGIGCTFYRDNYLRNNWYLEVFSEEAGKERGVRRLKTLIGAERVVAFGDNDNDCAMLREADVACVVANATPAARALADVVVGSNDDDGVARYIERRFEGGALG